MRLSGAQFYFLEDSLQGPSQEKSRRRQQVEFWDKLLIQDEVWFMHTFNRDGGRGQALQELRSSRLQGPGGNPVYLSSLPERRRFQCNC